MLNKFRQWMSGRYGTDQLNLFLLGVYLFLWLISMPFRRIIWISTILTLFSYVVVILLFYRMLSKDRAKRYRENERFLRICGRVRGKWNVKSRHLKERKAYHFYTCSQCGQKIRIPRGKGKICITCPKCRHEFVKKS